MVSLEVMLSLLPEWWHFSKQLFSMKHLVILLMTLSKM